MVTAEANLPWSHCAIHCTDLVLLLRRPQLCHNRIRNVYDGVRRGGRLFDDGRSRAPQQQQRPLVEGLSLLSLPSVTGLLLSYLIQLYAPRAALGFGRLGVVLYVVVAVWRATDATAAYFFARAAVNMRLPPGSIPWPRESFIPTSGNRFFVAPLLLPVAMIVNGCAYTVRPGLWSAAVVIGSITLAIFAVWVYVLSTYGMFLFWALRRQSKAVKTSRPKSSKIEQRRIGWITRTLDEMARQVFVFGSADALQKWRADSKKRL
ncbi:hypothetical protein C8R45DRAFT_105153 [Mycena sanguinolenta]|nr:hypothetical protein C8R45DRAFT_105153 [Mycena sanguinolenta]